MKKQLKLKYLGLGVIMAMIGCSPKKVVISPKKVLNPEPLDAVVVKGTKDPQGENQWAKAANFLDLENVWKEYNGAKIVKVAILSTGVDYNHPDLRASLYRNMTELAKYRDNFQGVGTDDDGNGYVDDYAGWNVVEQNGYPYDNEGLGTAAAGIIGAVHNNDMGVKGISKNITLVPVKYINSDGRVTLPNFLSGVKYALKQDAKVIFAHLSNIPVGGTDFGSPASADMEALVKRSEEAALSLMAKKLKQAGAVLVVSAGNLKADMNSGGEGIIKFLSKFKDEVVVVSSIDKENKRPRFANYGQNSVTTFAPGVDIVTTLPGGKYGKVSGTFAAAAQVAGAMALGMTHFSEHASKACIVSALRKDEASNPIDEDNYLYDQSLGKNTLNVYKYLTYLKNNPGC